MTAETPFYILRLRDELSLRQRTNRSFSLRAYARQLKIEASSLSSVLKGKRPLPLKKATFIAQHLGLSPSEKTQFLDSVLQKNKRRSQTSSAVQRRHFQAPSQSQILKADDETSYSIISEWEHYAIFELVETKDFKPDPQWLAQRLDISKIRVESALERLFRTGLLKIDDQGNVAKCIADIKTSEDLVSVAIKKSHKEALTMGIDKLETIPLSLRDFSTVTFPVNLRQIPQAKALIRKFRKELARLLQDGKKTEVFQFCLQLYPLTKIQKDGNS